VPEYSDAAHLNRQYESLLTKERLVLIAIHWEAHHFFHYYTPLFQCASWYASSNKNTVAECEP
jgi:hypothetical protein